MKSIIIRTEELTEGMYINYQDLLLYLLYTEANFADVLSQETIKNKQEKIILEASKGAVDGIRKALEIMMEKTK